MGSESEFVDEASELASQHTSEPKKDNWKTMVLEEGAIIFVLISIGLVVAAVKLGPVLMRWARS
jgi:hypothetical protein